MALAGVWGGLAFLVLGYRIDDYCEDADICTDAAPIRACAQLLIAIVGVVSTFQLAGAGVRYASTGETPGEKVRRRVVPAGASLVLWLLIVGTLRFP
jgi:hypothetical protein